MALQEQTAKLVDKLTELSEQGKVNWQETAAEEDTFLASVGKFVVTVGKADSRYPGYAITIADQTGKMLEDARVEDRGYDGEDHYYSALASLHKMARRKALHVDEALSDLLSSLEQLH